MQRIVLYTLKKSFFCSCFCTISFRLTLLQSRKIITVKTAQSKIRWRSSSALCGFWGIDLCHFDTGSLFYGIKIRYNKYGAGINAAAIQMVDLLDFLNIGGSAFVFMAHITSGNLPEAVALFDGKMGIILIRIRRCSRHSMKSAKGSKQACRHQNDHCQYQNASLFSCLSYSSAFHLLYSSIFLVEHLFYAVIICIERMFVNIFFQFMSYSCNICNLRVIFWTFPGGVRNRDLFPVTYFGKRTKKVMAGGLP